MKILIKILIITVVILSMYLLIFKIIDIDNIIMKKIYPLKYYEYIEKYSKEFKVDKYMICSIIKAESNFNLQAKSNKSAIGLMQIIETTAEETARKLKMDTNNINLYDPEINIKIGIKYFSEILKKYDGNYNLAIIAYNAGIGNVDNWIKEGIINKDGTNLENIPFKETNNYIRKVLRNYEIYKQFNTQNYCYKK